jgi:hypothetical protein
MLITICRLDESHIDANRVILTPEAAKHSAQLTTKLLGHVVGNGLRPLHDGSNGRGALVVTTKAVSEEPYLWLLDLGERHDGSVRMRRWYLQVPRERVIDVALDGAERYEGSDSELLTLLSR